MEPFMVIAVCAALLLGGALLGLLPLLVGRSTGKPELGKLGMLASTLSGLIFLSLPVSVGFLIAILVKTEDYVPRRAAVNQSAQTFRMTEPPPRHETNGLCLICLSGPLRGQSYPIGRNGLMMGRELSCAVCFPSGTPGVSGKHCCLRWQNGRLMLIDLNSRYGTFQGDGRQLPPNYPMPLTVGSRFYLGDTSCLFQIANR